VSLCVCVCVCVHVRARICVWGVGRWVCTGVLAPIFVKTEGNEKKNVYLAVSAAFALICCLTPIVSLEKMM
jgi:hypothetical protein